MLLRQVRELTSIVRNQIADSTTRGGQKGLLDDYADVLSRAWRATDGLCRYEVEETLIQVLCAPACGATAASWNVAWTQSALLLGRTAA